MVTVLRAGHGIRQAFETFVDQAPEPAESSCGQVRGDLVQGLSIGEALGNWQQARPSAFLSDVVATIQHQQQTGGNLAFMLEPLGEEILAEVGSDGCFYPAMKELAQSDGAQLPARALV